MRNIYVAASFAYAERARTEARKAIIEQVIEKVKKAFYENKITADFYLPHQLKIENAWDISLEEWCQKVYEHDIAALLKADTVIFLSFGKENNAGAVWEVGWAAGHNQCLDATVKSYAKKIICIKMTDDAESLMVSQSVDAIIREDEIDSYDWIDMPHYRTKLDKLS